MPTRRPTPRTGLGRGDRLPRIASPPPGPASSALARRLRRSEAPGVNTLYRDQPALAWELARGANVLDVDGNRFVDLTAGFGVAAVGHGHRRCCAPCAPSPCDCSTGSATCTRIGRASSSPKRSAASRRSIGPRSISH
jgi:hypothetical protein